MSDIEEINVEEFLIKWRKENNTELAVYSSYHIDAMEAYAIEYNKTQQQTIDNLTKENTKLMEQLKDIKSQLFDVNNCDTILTLAIEQLLNK